MRDYRTDAEIARDDARRRSRKPLLKATRTGAALAKAATPETEDAPNAPADRAGAARTLFDQGGKAVRQLGDALEERALSAADARAAAAGVRRSLEARAAGDRFTASQALRFLISLGWAGLGLALMNAAAGGFSFGLSAADAARAGGWLYLLAGAGAIAAMVGIAFAALRGGLSPKGIEAASAVSGVALADEMRRAHGGLSRAAHDAGDVAEMALAGERAEMLYSVFRAEGAGAVHQYQDFIEREAAAPTRRGDSAGLAVLLALLLGVGAGAAGVLVLSDSALRGLAASANGVGLSLAAGATLALAAAYLGAGLIAGPLAGLILGPLRAARWARSRARVAEGLKAAPDAAEFSARLDAALSAAGGSVARRSPAPAHSGASLRIEPEAVAAVETAEPRDWRRRDEADAAPRFVDTGFQAAPPTFRAGEKR